MKSTPPNEMLRYTYLIALFSIRDFQAVTEPVREGGGGGGGTNNFQRKLLTSPRESLALARFSMAGEL